MMNEYEKQAQDFLEKTGTTFTAEKTGHDLYFPDDKESRDIYKITLERIGKKEGSFRFGQSIANSATKKNLDKIKYSDSMRDQLKAKRRIKAPSVYDVLASVQKSDIGTFSDFCNDFGYDEDSRKAEKTYLAVQEEFAECSRMFGDVLESLEEIQ